MGLPEDLEAITRYYDSMTPKDYTDELIIRGMKENALHNIRCVYENVPRKAEVIVLYDEFPSDKVAHDDVGHYHKAN
jgi:hypothetical protein